MIKQTPTKDILFQSFCQLCQEKPIDKITIDDIVNNCGMKRGIFYYYYKDKTDLIVTNMTSTTINIHKDNYGKFPWERIVEMNCEKLLEFKVINRYLNGNRIGYNYGVKDFFYDYIFQIVNDYYGAVDEQMKNIILFYCGGSMELITHWINTNYQQSPKQLAAGLVQAVHPKLLKALNKE